MTRSKRKIPFIGKSKYAVIIDGETEYWYLKMIQRNERHSKIDIKPEIPQKKKLIDQYIKVKELSNIYDKVIWIVDLDVVIKESKLKEFIKYKHDLEQNIKNSITIINQPCLEYWLLLHFSSSSPNFTICGEAEALLKKHLTDYSKKQNYFTKQNNDIYLKLRPHLTKAIDHSKKQGDFKVESPSKGFSNMHKLFEELGIN